MIGSQEWMDMIDQEIKELQRLIDRKAEKNQIAKFKVAYESTQKSNLLKKKGIKESKGENSSKNTASSSKIQIYSTSSSILDEELNHIEKNSSTDSLRTEYKFGYDLHNDFTTLFSAFNRVAKNKLDRTVLSDFASVSFIDSLYEKKSVAFSSQLTDSYHLYYRHFDEKITTLSNKIAKFHHDVINKLNEMDSLAKSLQNRLNRMFINRKQNTQEEEELTEIINLKGDQESEELSTSRSESKFMKSSHIELSNDPQKKFAKTIVIKRTPLFPHPDD